MRVVISPFFQDLIKYETTISPFHFVSLYIWLSAIFPGILKRWKTENQGLHKSMFIETLCWRLKRFLFVENNTFNIEWALLSHKQNVQKYFDKRLRCVYLYVFLRSRNYECQSNIIFQFKKKKHFLSSIIFFTLQLFYLSTVVYLENP